MSKSFFPNKIALVGHAYSGKSSTAREISRRYGHKIISLASPIKEVDWAFSFLGIPPKIKQGRENCITFLGYGQGNKSRNFLLVCWRENTGKKYTIKMKR